MKTRKEKRAGLALVSLCALMMAMPVSAHADSWNPFSWVADTVSKLTSTVSTVVRVVTTGTGAFVNNTVQAVAALPSVVVAVATGTANPPVKPLDSNFYFGVSMSAFQSEGSYRDSNWLRAIKAGRKDEIFNSVDFIHRYPEDLALAKGLGVNVFRTGIDWARVQPQKGVWDEQALKYYDDLFQRIANAGMRPMITLDHWTYPGWALDFGGWSNANMSSYWLTYARKMVDRYAKFNPMWVTINEPNLYPFQDQNAKTGITPAGVLSGILDAPRHYDQLVFVHKAIYDYIHSLQRNALVTSNTAYIPFLNDFSDALFLDRLGASKLDMASTDVYYGLSALDMSFFNSEMSDKKIEPEYIYYALRYYGNKFPGKPLYIVENGMPTNNGYRKDGYQRDAQIRDTIYWVQRAKQDGINVIGYNYWSLADNYEWGSYDPRFGLYTVDVRTDASLTRRPTVGVNAYKTVIANRGVPSGYKPTVAPAFCSLVDFPKSCLNPVFN